MRDGPTARTGLLYGAAGRERHSQEASQLFYLLVNKTPARDKLTSSVTLIWLCLLRRFSSFWPSKRWLSRDSRPLFSASYLAVPHSSLSPSSLHFGYSNIRLPPSLGFCFFSAREASVSNRATEAEGGGEDGSDRLKRKQTLGMDLQRICPSIHLTSFSKTLLFLSARNPIGFAATHSLYRPRPLCI